MTFSLTWNKSGIPALGYVHLSMDTPFGAFVVTNFAEDQGKLENWVILLQGSRWGTGNSQHEALSRVEQFLIGSAKFFDKLAKENHGD